MTNLLQMFRRFPVLALVASVGTATCACEEKTVATLPRPAIQETPGYEAGKGSLTGKITLKGTIPTPDTEISTKGQHHCEKHGNVRTERWKVAADGGLAEAVVYVLGVPPSPLLKAVEIHQINCIYQPHMLSVASGQRVDIFNDDATYHNVRIVRHKLGTANEGENQANYQQPRQGDRRPHDFTASGIYRLECDVHRWMRCWVFVHGNGHHAVSQADGTFRIDRGLPDGKYTVEAWHPQFPEALRQEIEVKDGKAVAEFVFDASQAFRNAL